MPYTVPMPRQAQRERTIRNVTLSPELVSMALELGRQVGVPTLSRIIDQALIAWMAQARRAQPLPPTPSTRAGRESDGGRSHVPRGE